MFVLSILLSELLSISYACMVITNRMNNTRLLHDCYMTATVALWRIEKLEMNVLFRFAFFALLVTGTVIILYIYLIQMYITNQFWITKAKIGLSGTTTRNILLWNPYPEDRVLFGTRHILAVKDSCPVNDCFVTKNHSYLPSVSQYDAIVFLVPHLQFLDENHTRPAERSAEQRYVFYSDEPAWKNHLDLTLYKNYFNWTLS